MDIVCKEADLNVVFKRCSGEEYMAGLAASGAPVFFQEDMLENMRWGEEWGFFCGEGTGCLYGP